MTERRRILVDGVEYFVEVLDGIAVLPDGRSLEVEHIEHLSPVDPGAIYCVHLNYQSRLDELGYSLPAAPTYFQKSRSCLNHHEGEVARPANCQYLNYEGEVALVVGRTTARITPDEAKGHIAGYTVANDFGLHDFRDTDANSMVRVKGADTLGPIGPALISDWDFRGKELRTSVNGQLVQRASLDELIWDPHYLLADLSRTHTLRAGDVILTGTPANSRPVVPGDVVEVEVEGLGVLRNSIVESGAVAVDFGAQPSSSSSVRAVAVAQAVQP